MIRKHSRREEFIGQSKQGIDRCIAGVDGFTPLDGRWMLLCGHCGTPGICVDVCVDGERWKPGYDPDRSNLGIPAGIGHMAGESCGSDTDRPLPTSSPRYVAGSGSNWLSARLCNGLCNIAGSGGLRPIEGPRPTRPGQPGAGNRNDRTETAATGVVVHGPTQDTIRLRWPFIGGARARTDTPGRAASRPAIPPPFNGPIPIIPCRINATGFPVDRIDH